ALTRGMSSKVQPLLSPDAPVLDSKTANCAMFYSITNCQEGLRRVPFGNFLLKKVAEDLSRELPQIRTFATVSPVPNFMDWLADMVRTREKHPHHRKWMELLSKLREPEWWRDKSTSEMVQRE